MRRLTGFLGFVAIVASFSLFVEAAGSRGRAPERPVEREKGRSEREKEREGIKVDEHGRPCEGACKAISSGRGTETRPQEEPRAGKEEAIIEASVKSVKEPKVQKEVRETLEAQVKDLDASAKEGLLYREEMLAKSRSSSPETKKEIDKRGEEGFFLTSLLGRLKEKWKDQIETLKKLVCASECGHRGMGKSCRVVAQLAQKLASAAIPAGAMAISGLAVHEVIKDDGSSKIKVEVSFDGAELKKPLVLNLEDKEQPEEKVALTKTASSLKVAKSSFLFGARIRLHQPGRAPGFFILS